MSNSMRAWRTQYYAEPLEALKLDEVPIPQAGDNEVVVRVQGIPLNLNDLERVPGNHRIAVTSSAFCQTYDWIARYWVATFSEG